MVKGEEAYSESSLASVEASYYRQKRHLESPAVSSDSWHQELSLSELRVKPSQLKAQLG